MTKALALAVVLLGSTWCAASRAEVQKIAPDGVVYRVQVEPWTGTGNPKATGTALRLYVQRRDGTLDSSLVTGTDDAIIDQDPAIEIDAANGKPVLVWSRGDAGGYDVYLSRYDGATWSPIRPVVAQPGDDGLPDIRIGYYLIHVVWHQDLQSQNTLVRVSLDRATLDTAFGPEVLPTPSTVTSASDSSTNTPPYSDAFFAAELPGRVGGSDPGRIAVWGVRDAPVPVDYCHWITLPTDAKGVRRPLARYVRDRFVVSFDDPSRFYYAQRFWFGWTDLRVVNLSGEVSASDARIQIEEMIRRAWF